jgi:6-phosphogluconolactonase
MELVVAHLEDLQAQLAAGFEALAARGPLTCALSGGPGALIFLSALRAATPDWSAVRLFFTDERGDGGGVESNASLATRMLVEPLAGARPRVFPMPAGPDLVESAAAYDAVLDRELGDRAPDLAIVGLGEDGHLAGLFAGHPALAAPARVAAVHDAPRPPHRRLTFTLPYLASVGEIWVVGVGARKRAVVQAAVSRAGTRTPLDHVLRQASAVTIFTDQPLRHG